MISALKSLGIVFLFFSLGVCGQDEEDEVLADYWIDAGGDESAVGTAYDATDGEYARSGGDAYAVGGDAFIQMGAESISPTRTASSNVQAFGKRASGKVDTSTFKNLLALKGLPIEIKDSPHLSMSSASVQAG